MRRWLCKPEMAHSPQLRQSDPACGAAASTATGKQVSVTRTPPPTCLCTVLLQCSHSHTQSRLSASSHFPDTWSVHTWTLPTPSHSCLIHPHLLHSPSKRTLPSGNLAGDLKQISLPVPSFIVFLLLLCCASVFVFYQS